MVNEESAFVSGIRSRYASHTMSIVILSERSPERFRGPEERKLLGVGSGVVSEESAFRATGFMAQ